MLGSVQLDKTPPIPVGSGALIWACIRASFEQNMPVWRVHGPLSPFTVKARVATECVSIHGSTVVAPPPRIKYLDMILRYIWPFRANAPTWRCLMFGKADLCISSPK